MSTDYYIHCKNCKESTWSYSRQAWGWGNADIIRTFRFLFKHTSSCGEENILFVSEHDERSYPYYNGENGVKEFDESLAKTTYPHSNDWNSHKEQYEEYLKAKKGL